MPRKVQPVAAEPKRARVLKASATRLDPTSDEAAAIVKGSKQKWTERAWTAFDTVGEVKAGARFVESCCSRVTIALGIIPGPGLDAVPVHEAIERGLILNAPTDQVTDGADSTSDLAQAATPVVRFETLALAESLVYALCEGQESEGALLGGWGAKSFVTGECYYVAWKEKPLPPVPGAPPAIETDEEAGEERWLCVSSDELVVSSKSTEGSRFTIRRLPKSGAAGQGSKTTGPGEIVLPADAFFLRVWRPHARFAELADSNLRGCLNECEELNTLGASIRAAGLSRISAGLLYIADGIRPAAHATEEDESPETPEGSDQESSTIVEDLIRHQNAPVADPAAPSRLTPLVMTGPASVDGISAKDMIFTIDLARPLDPEIIKRCEYLIERIANTVELPAERLTGMGASNHWTAWQIDEETYRLYIAPVVAVPIGALTRKYLRARLIASNVPPAEAAAITLIGDPSELVTRPNRVENARIAHEALAINDEALRTALGFGDEDEPTGEEIARRIIQRQTVLPADVVPLLNEVLGTDITEPAQPAAAPPGSGGTPNVAEQPEPAEPQEAGAPNDGNPNQPTADTVTASARRRGPGERLMSIDRKLRMRVQAAAEMAVDRAIERAGARMRTRLASARPGTAMHEAKMTTTAVTNRRMLATLGFDAIVRLGIDPDELIDAEFDDLHEHFDDWTASAQDEALTISAAHLGIENPGQLDHARERQTNGRRAAWTALAAGLLVQVRRSIHDMSVEAAVLDAPRGELVAGTVAPSLIRYSLAIAGGSTPRTTTTGAVLDGVTGGFAGGVATGDDIEALWGAYGEPWSGYEWVYNYDGPSPFEQHLDLAGVRFTSNDDDVLATEGTGAEWVGVYFFPGDHNGCQCDAIPVFAGE